MRRTSQQKLVVPHKSKHLLAVLSLRLTEQHYFERLGWKKHIEADCSWEMRM